MFVTVNGQRIFFDTAGGHFVTDGPTLREKPTLLLLHGGPGFDHTSFRPEFDAFSDIAHVMYLDHRGNGRSVPSDPKTWNLDQWGDDIFGFCEALGIEKPIVFGQSFGGMVAQSYATRHPNHPRAVVFSSTAARIDLDTSLRLFREKGGDEAGKIAERFWTIGSEQDFADYTRHVMPLYNTNPRPGGEDARARATMRQEVYRHFSLPGCEMRQMDLRAALGKIACPTLVLAGADDPITPPHLAREIAEAIPRGLARLEIFDGCGHGAFRDDQDRVFPVIRDFIASSIAR